MFFLMVGSLLVFSFCDFGCFLGFVFDFGGCDLICDLVGF